jgi:hypothetical protein
MESKKKKNEIGWWEMLRLRCFRPGVKTQDLADKKKKNEKKNSLLFSSFSSPELLTWWLLEDGFLVTFSYPSSRQVEEKEGKKGW